MESVVTLVCVVVAIVALYGLTAVLPRARPD